MRLRLILSTFSFFSSFICVILVGLSLHEDNVPDHYPVEGIPRQLEEVVESKKIVSETYSAPKMESQQPVYLKNESKTNAAKSPQIMIYHSHNRESWIPELNNVSNPNHAFDSKINVTLLGGYLQKILQSSDIPVFHSDIDYPSQITDFEYAKSYTYSKHSVKDELKKHKNVKYLFDLHRDSQSREDTTIMFNDQNYAQVYFVVGTNHPNWTENKIFAERVQERLNERIPNLSKGIYEKDKTSGNGEYNQSLSGNSALIEIGGVENSLEESYRTIEVLAEVIQDIWSEDYSQLAVSSPSI